MHLRPGIAGLAAAALLAGCGGVQTTSTTVRSPGSVTTATTATTTPTTKPAAPRPVKLTVEVNGDLLIHSPVWETALADGPRHYNFFAMLREIAPYIKHADLPICHVETPMTPRPPHGYPVFNTPPALARAIKQTGWGVCATA